jgi:hypothetical protein
MRARMMIALLGTAVIAPLSVAQMRAPISFNHVSVRSRYQVPGPILLGSPSFYADYAEPFAPQTAPPQVFIMQPAPAPEAPPEAKAEPLLIELQGNRYVRFGGTPQSAERGVNVPLDYAEATKPAQSAAQPQLALAVLIFRDGHREQVREYAIVSGVLYADQNYWENGRWTKNIQLSALNLPATAKANRDNGIKFLLPTGPNEVVTRP